LCGMPVVGELIPDARGSDRRPFCRAWFQMGVMVTERPSCRRGSIRVWSADAGGARTTETGAPNTPMQLTPLRVREIGAYLKRRIGPVSVPI